MARLYAATGDSFARLDQAGEAWTVEVSLPGSGAQCLAVDPDDPHGLELSERVVHTFGGGQRLDEA